MNHSVMTAFLPFWAILLVSSSSIHDVYATRISSLIVPKEVGRGQDAQLRCEFNFEGQTILAVKWFKGTHEFFRVTPDKSRIFPLAGLTVDPKRSNVSTVYLRDVQKSNAGVYRCEVTGEAPHFITDHRESEMRIIDLPEHGPIITNQQTNYRPGEKISLNCSSSPSNPSPIIYWIIDGNPAPDAYVKRYLDDSSSYSSSHRTTDDEDRLDAGTIIFNNRNDKVVDGHQQQEQEREQQGTSVIVGLEFTAELPRQISIAGPYSLRNATCVVSVGDIYRSSSVAQLRIFDGRSTTRATTVRTPFHFLSNGGISLHYRTANNKSHISSWMAHVSVLSNCIYFLHCVLLVR